MSLIEKSTVEVTSLPTGEIQIVTWNTIEKDGEVLSRKPHYDVLQPGADVSMWPEVVQKSAQAHWTPETIAPFTAEVQAKIQEQAAARVALKTETAAHEAAKVASEVAKTEADQAKAEAQTAADAAEVENKRLADAKAVADAAEKAAKDKAMFAAEVAAQVAVLSAESAA